MPSNLNDRLKPSEKPTSAADRLLSSLVVEPLRPSHGAEIAALHFKELQWSFNGSFGLDHVTDLYGSLGNSPAMFGYVVRHRRELLGFVTATTDSSDARRIVQGVYTHRPWQTLVRLLRPRFLLGALESKLIVPYFFRKYGVSAEWLTLITDTSKGFVAPLVALKLSDAVRDHYRNAGISVYAAQGLKTNPRAIALYEALNWRIIATLPVHNIYLYSSDAPNSASALGIGT